MRAESIRACKRQTSDGLRKGSRCIRINRCRKEKRVRNGRVMFICHYEYENVALTEVLNVIAREISNMFSCGRTCKSDSLINNNYNYEYCMSIKLLFYVV